MRIAVLGNGPSLRCHHYGAQIDACDVVVRINRFDVTARWWRHVGSRTDIYATYFPFRLEMLALVESWKLTALWWVEIGDVHDIMVPWRASWVPVCAKHHIAMHTIPEATVARCYAELGITEEERAAADKKPTSGVVVLAHAREVWPDAEVYAAGFDGYRPGEPGYYWSSAVVEDRALRKVAVDKQRAWYAAQVAAGRVLEFADA